MTGSDPGTGSGGGRLGELLGRMRTQTLYMMRREFARPEAVGGHLVAHLEWLIGLEKEGRVMLSGPLVEEDGAMRAGITVLRCVDLAQARSLAQEDPLVRSGVASFEVTQWRVNEGRLTVSVDLSDGEVRIG